MSWVKFDYNDYECGLFWLLVTLPEVDIDAGEDGQTIGHYAGGSRQIAVLAMVEEGHDGLPCFDAVDSANFGSVPDDGAVTHFAEVKAPAFPADLGST